MIPSLATMECQLMQQEFAVSIVVIWCVLTGITRTGLVSCLITKDIPMSDELDKVFVLDGAGGTIGAGKHVGIDVEVEMGVRKEDGVDGTLYEAFDSLSPTSEVILLGGVMQNTNKTYVHCQLI
ncbi:hypothetical protein K439DRAFT_1664732 [Ramaria rubella]|nr:hypothetical protein K439DRAFT_1664732 [Ramaria rubella]